MSVFNPKTGVFILALAAVGIGIKMSGLIDTVIYQIEYYTNKDNLTDMSGQKFILKKGKNILFFINIDCTEFASEKNKILFVNTWRELPESISDYKTVIVVRLLNDTDSGRSEFTNYVSMINNSLTAYKKPTINVCIEEDRAFRSKYSITAESQCVAILDGDKVQAVETFGSFYYGISSTRLMSIIEDKIRPYFGETMVKMSEDSEITKGNDTNDNTVEDDYIYL